MHLISILAALSLQNPPASSPVVDPKEIDSAIQRGILFLRRPPQTPPVQAHGLRGDLHPIQLLTFARAGVSETDPDYQRLYQNCMNYRMGTADDGTYEIALLAMALEEYDRVKAQRKIAQCAQYLVDSQGSDGRWTYKGVFRADASFPELDKPVVEQTPRLLAEDGKPKVLRRVVIRKAGEPRTVGDHSNTQYAVLGLRACHDSGMIIPEETIRRGEKAWRESLIEEPSSGPAGKPGVTTGPGAGGAGATAIEGRSAGWAYGPVQKDQVNKATGSMTAGGVGSLVIYAYLQKKDWRKDADVEAGLRWLGLHFDDLLARRDQVYPMYSYYAFERVGTLYGTETLGKHAWHAEGAAALLKAQRPDGSWINGGLYAHPILDTCYAILFLKRATRPLVGRSDIATPGQLSAPSPLPAAPETPKPPLEKTVAEMAERCQGSVALVRTDTRSGAGFFVAGEGFLVTHHAVIAGGPRVVVETTSSGGSTSKAEAEVYAMDLVNDLALLKVRLENPPPALPLEVPATAKAGDPVVAVGPKSAGRTLQEMVVAGTVSNPATAQPGRRVIETSVALDPSSRGTPVLGLSGRVTGLAAPQEGDKSAAGRAIPADLIQALLDARDGGFRVHGALLDWETRKRLELRKSADPAKSIPLEAPISRWILDDEGDRILALQPAMNRLVQISLSERKITRAVVTGAEPSALSWTFGRTKAVWVANRGAKNLVRVDLDRGVVEETVPVPIAICDISPSKKYLWCLAEDSTIHGVDASEKKHLGLLASDVGLGVWYDAKRDHLLVCGRTRLVDYDASKLGPLMRELTRTNLTPKERGDLKDTMQKSAKIFPSLGAAGVAGLTRTIGCGFLVDEKNGRVYLNRAAASLSKPETAVGILAASAPHSMVMDPAVSTYIRQNPSVEDILAASPDGRWVATGLHLYNSATFAIHKELPLPSMMVAFSKDSRQLYYYDWVSHTISMLDVDSK